MYVSNLILFIFSFSVNVIKAEDIVKNEGKNNGKREGTDEQINFQDMGIDAKFIQLFNSLFEDIQKLRKAASQNEEYNIELPYEEIFSSWKKIGIKKDSEKMNQDTVENIQHNLEINNSSLDTNVASEAYKKAVSMMNSNYSNKKEAYSLLINASLAGNYQAKADVAWALMCGTHLPQNISLAKQLFEQLAEEGFPDGHTGMGFIHSVGLSGKASQAKALLHYTIGALGGSHWSRMILGFRYWFGYTVSSNCEKALNFYRQVASYVASVVEANGGAVVHRIRLLDEEEDPAYQSGLIDDNVKDYYEMLAVKGEVSAQLGLGQLYYRGARGLPKDYMKALYYFQMATAAGNAVAMAFMGKIYLEGDENINVDLMKAYLNFRKSADQGNAIGQYGLGLMYLEGKYVEKNTQKAIAYLSQSANQGWVESLLVMGTMYLQGKTLRRDYTMARKYFIMASQVGHILGYYNLAQMHSSGIGIMRSCTTAVELFKHVSERAKWGTQLMEAYRHYKNNRYSEAFVMYALFAEMGYEVGQSNAAFILDQGLYNIANEDKEERYQRARVYWGRSALQGNPLSLIKLGDYYYYGLGTKTDYDTAMSYYRIAYEQYRNPQATFNMGYMHEHGLGVQRDLHLAKRCYDSAAEASPDAEFPVFLALIKLQFVATLSELRQAEWQRILALEPLNQYLGHYWDIYLGVFFLLCGAYILHFRINRRDLLRDILIFL